MPTRASVHRYIRRHVHKQSFDIFVSCLPELENDTSLEIKHLVPGLMPSPIKGGVEVRATLQEIYRLNLGLSTANRILLRLARFPAWSFPMMFDNARRIFWPAFISSPKQTRIHVTTSSSRLNMKHRVASTFQSAITAAFDDYSGEPSGGPSTIYVRIVKDSVTVSLDTTGEHLHKRGDKVMTDMAPLRSTLASFALRPMFAAKIGALCDPFCGSGTILMEAARIKAGLAPGANRSYAFVHHPYFRDGTWRQAIRDDAEHRRAFPDVKLLGGDVREKAVRTTQDNLASLGPRAADGISVDVLDFRNSLGALSSSKNALVTNPPYGVRLGDQRTAQQLQQTLVNELERFRTPLMFAVFSPFPDLYVHSSLRIEEVTPLRLGGLSLSLIQGTAGPQQ